MTTRLEFEAIGTHWYIAIEDTLDEFEEKKLLIDIYERIEIFDKAYSRFRSDSLVTEISQKVGVYTLPADAQPMMDLYADLYEKTEGHLTPLIGQVMVDAGYDALYSLEQHKTLEQPPSWHDVLEYNYPKLVVKKPVLLDFGAAGKGYLIDIIAGILKKHALENFTIDAGGDILHRDVSHSLIKIGLEDPNNFSQAIGVVELGNKSLCGSAGSRRKWKNFHHIIDPFKLSSPKEIIATWVIADTTLLADALASCLFFVAPSKLVSHYRFEYVILYADYSIERSKDFPGELFVQ